MKNLLYILFLLFFVPGLAQEANVFGKPESENIFSNRAAIDEVEEDSTIIPPKHPGGPPDGENWEEMPIDDYVPLLALTAFGLIVYTKLTKRRTQ